MARKRKSGTGTIRQRKDGRWEGRAVVGYDDKGLPKTKNVLAKTKHECQEKLTKLMETVGSTKSEKICADMPFGEWMDFWYQTYIKSGLRPATQNTYESICTCMCYHYTTDLGFGIWKLATGKEPSNFKVPLDFDAPSTDTVYVRRDVYGVFHSGTVAPVRGDHPHPAPVRPDWPIVNPKT